MPKITSPHDYQATAINETFDNWLQGVVNVCLVAPTGAGKTIVKAFAAKRYLDENPDKYVVVFAHRDVLLTQISLAIASIGLPHKMICSKATNRLIGDSHIEELGECYLTDSLSNRLFVVSVPTWIKRDTSDINPLVGMWAMDEAHHTLDANMWGKAVKPLVNAVGLGVTATPKRTDGKGLGRHHDGVFDTIIKTPGMGELILRGRLSHYKVYAPPANIDMSKVNVTATGEYNQTQLAKATDLPDITGGAVEHYLKLAKGKQGIVFAASIAHSDHVAAEFRANGVNAVALSSKTKDAVRQQKIKDFRRGKIELLVNYDLFGEGFDVPAVEVVIMLRKTLSYGLFKQMFGRCLRVLKGKSHGILIDHVGNVSEHCSHQQHVHDDPEWTLDREGKKKSGGAEGILTRTCPKCWSFYAPLKPNIKYFICPECGHAETAPEINDVAKKLQIEDGVLVEYDTGYIKELMDKIKKVDEPVESMRSRMKYAGMSPMIVASATKKHTERQEAQVVLREWIISWCNETGLSTGLDLTTTQNEFTRILGVNIFKAQTLSSTDAIVLTEKIKTHLLEKRLFG